MAKDVIVACDFAGRAETLAFLDKFEGRKPFVKIGMELYYAEGPDIVREIKARGDFGELAVFCRIGSSEIYLHPTPAGRVVFCRIGSSESVLVRGEQRDGVFCRIGSSER